MNTKMPTAIGYSTKVRLSPDFQDAVVATNTWRHSQGLSTVTVIVPEFTALQVILDTIRGYNGWVPTTPYFVNQFNLNLLHEFMLDMKSISGFGTILDLQNERPDPQHPGQSLADAVWIEVTESQRSQAGQTLGTSYVRLVQGYLGQ